MLSGELDTIVIDVQGEQVEIAYTDTPRGVLLDCLAYVHPKKFGRQWSGWLHRGFTVELEDLIPDWNARQDIKDMIHRSIYE